MHSTLLSAVKSKAVFQFSASTFLVPLTGGGSLRGVADAFAETPTNGQREQLPGVDILYLKNVLLKFLDSAAAGRTEQVGTHR